MCEGERRTGKAGKGADTLEGGADKGQRAVKDKKGVGKGEMEEGKSATMRTSEMEAGNCKMGRGRIRGRQSKKGGGSLGRNGKGKRVTGKGERKAGQGLYRTGQKGRGD
jgi:hypothetical protein